MALTENQAKILAALAGEPDRKLTAWQLGQRTGLTAPAIRDELHGPLYDGFVTGSPYGPGRWQITAEGRALLRTRPYRENLPPHDTTMRQGDR
ncbi:hypothetical protein [Nocardia sp. CNY236]|uniref:hypothetical protein n=1 Tax=Nocardia sp. CNY236 TaxID=1169152 RepID=UPI0003FDDB90|nr:hypothetical protein [Nocardia sp. CNY236]